MNWLYVEIAAITFLTLALLWSVAGLVVGKAQRPVDCVMCWQNLTPGTGEAHYSVCLRCAASMRAEDLQSSLEALRISQGEGGEA
jgi:hypothetical protein